MATYICHFQTSKGKHYTQKIKDPDFNALRRSNGPQFLYATKAKERKRKWQQ